MWQRLCELLEDPKDRHILVIGDFMIDHYLYGDAERISPEAPVPVLRVIDREDALGGAGSVAADITALGARAHCVGMVGEPPDSERLSDMLTASGADASGLVRVPGRKTTLKSRLVGLAQHKHRQQLIRIDEESTEPISETTIRRLIEQVERHLPACSVVCIEDYNKGVVSESLSREVIGLARKRGVPVLVDPAGLGSYSRYAGAYAITPNRSETERLIGVRLRSMDAVESAARQILAACHTEYACVTLDAEGIAIIGPDGQFEHIPTKKRDVYDVTGAGDEVLAAMAVALAAGGTLREAAALANIAGGLEVEKFGCVPITRDEVLGELLMEHHQELGKIRTLGQLTPELARRRSRGQRIVFTNGCFDLVHAGHVATFALCREQGDIVIVGINSDASVRRLDKGSSRPIVPEAGRAAVVAAMENVDFVVQFDDDTPQRLIEAIQPDVLVKGRDWEGKPIAGQDVVESRGGRVVLAPLVEGVSTTQIIKRIQQGD
ncbi:MAG: bifunctional heptose 7-phosphate kinase/heptose 1-phosphate adenyltransferase [Phycisphaerae bacterium]|nr:bifunctional heptose 7-phosphate kinase/heptose 1-phosphate adenyltransferase [Phycisphaerae bacterium]